MSDGETYANACCDPRDKLLSRRVTRKLRRGLDAVKQWLRLNIWYRWLYRLTMKILHRFNLHYAPPTPWCSQVGERNHWCQWCGLRGTTYTHNFIPGFGGVKPK